eukprot:scaffold29424_cov54-Cyclotella_meneghiniana.AAC.5
MPPSKINRARCIVCEIVSIPAAKSELARSECQWGNVMDGFLLFERVKVHHHHRQGVPLSPLAVSRGTSATNPKMQRRMSS